MPQRKSEERKRFIRKQEEKDMREFQMNQRNEIHQRHKNGRFNVYAVSDWLTGGYPDTNIKLRHS